MFRSIVGTGSGFRVSGLRLKVDFQDCIKGPFRTFKGS